MDIFQLWNDIFWNITFSNWTNVLTELVVGILLILLLFYAIYFIVVKVTDAFFKSTIHKDYLLQLNYLVSLCIFLFIWNIYIFLLIRAIGTSEFNWTSSTFYFGLFPQLFIYIGTIVLFAVRYSGLQKQLRKKA